MVRFSATAKTAIYTKLTWSKKRVVQTMSEIARHLEYPNSMAVLLKPATGKRLFTFRKRVCKLAMAPWAAAGSACHNGVSLQL